MNVSKEKRGEGVGNEVKIKGGRQEENQGGTEKSESPAGKFQCSKWAHLGDSERDSGSRRIQKAGDR